MIGTTELKANDGSITTDHCSYVFTGLKFQTTCFNTMAKCFYLVVTLYQATDPLNILDSKISSPFHITSRKLPEKKKPEGKK